LRQKEKQFFFEKKNQKTFIYLGTNSLAKVFCFFFSKKKTFVG